MIKICHIVNHITGKADGVYTHLKMIFRCTDKNKFQNYLIFQGGEKVEKELTEMGIKIFVCRSLKKKISIKAFVDIYKFIKGNDIHIIHTHLVKPYAIAGFVNLFLRRKFIFNYHGLFIFRNVYYGFIEKIIYGSIHWLINIFKVVDVVLVPSKRSKELLISETKLFPEPVVYYNGYYFPETGNGINSELYKYIEKLKSEKIIIAAVGRLHLDKRIDRAINILKLIKHKNTHLLVFGDGELENDLRKLVKNLNLAEHVDLLGYVGGFNNYYKLFDVVLFTSDWEGMPLTMWEAMANKVPVLAPDVGGFREILEENNCGIIYRPGNVNDAAEKLISLLEDHLLRIKLGSNGKTAIELKYNEKKFINRLEQIYTSFLRI
jgi:glycosyltransferase involved in cell wall biosynthesis